ncbi:bifunctional (p)ppGpp synthetase/guanosine-3',5'-bis(diphosphate) 3'-pyrophosphohydrolase [Candidatus Parabeggiatoa sp. HSG14]|uniref:RelA/SpoT family protein n=1 Tax=Candidatus Parabeggiatoa sp. HSG14 TaxID=3055593 RepID=UPI0025A78B21|nr:bifunctional (p)ppGpp synthetase/guanosine-3',5'-bis(diphosphate) 3'-pyrophosphohydrolase [Thiotrichales bacterium HSG14]
MVSTTNPISIFSTNTLDIEAWVKRIAKDRPKAEQQTISKACIWAEEVHQSQTRAPGEPYLIHVITVADILAQLGMDTDVLVAAILHDVVENKQVTLDDIQKRFGSVIMRLVDGVAKMKFIEELNDHSNKVINTKNQTESLRKMLLAMAEDVRVVLIKLADRLDNMRLLRYQDKNKQQRVARETLDLFAPLANRLGIGQIKWELEDLSLRYLEPETYQKMAKLLDERRIDRENYIQEIMTCLSSALQHAGIKAEIFGRPKHIYSIWHKMLKKGIDFEKIFDVRAVRVLVNTVNECYMALGVIHNKWQPLQNEFDDYIANPKNNNYQSLHTTLIGPEQKIFEVQIRTHAMHHHAELGVASHWRYKEENAKLDTGFEQKIAWLRQILQWKDEEGDAGDFLDRFKSEIFEDHVYVLSPQGQVIDLPQGATPLDFAYYIHTQLGHCCRGAKINNRIVPLTYVLKSGDLVEILTSKVEKPSRDWLIPRAGYLKTLRARSKVKLWLKKQDNQQHVSEGRNLLERVLRRFNIKNYNLEQLAHNLRFKLVDDLLASVGRGDTTMLQIARAFKEQVLPKKQQSLPVVAKPSDTRDDIHIKGVGGLLAQTAGCCNPVPHNPIIGYITKGRGVVIHRCDCPNALHWQDEGNERLIEAEWSQPSIQQTLIYPLSIHVIAIDRPGLLRDICTIMTQEKINILATNTKTSADSNVKMMFTLEVNNLDQLSRALAKIDNLANVMKVWRKS